MNEHYTPMKSHRLKTTLILLIYFALFCGVFYPLFESMKQVKDYQTHIEYARQMAITGKLHSERFGFHILIYAASGFSPSLKDLAFGAVVISVLAMVCKVLISSWLMEREIHFMWSLILASFLVFLAPVTLRWSGHPIKHFRSPLHLGQISGFIIHNPTTVVVFPLALLLFYFSWKQHYLLTALLAGLQCLIKPNFVLAWIPAFLVLEIWRHRQEWQGLVKPAASLLPALGVLFFQYLTTERLGTGMVIAPLVAWRALSNNILFSCLRSLAFPVVFSVVYYKEVHRRPDHWFAWGIFFVAFLQYALFLITGPVYMGNWSWGRYLAIYLVFLLCLTRFAAVLGKSSNWRSPWRIAANVLILGILGLHFYSGIIYYLQGVWKARW